MGAQDPVTIYGKTSKGWESLAEKQGFQLKFSTHSVTVNSLQDIFSVARSLRYQRNQPIKVVTSLGDMVWY